MTSTAFSVERSLEVLQRTPAVLRAMVGGVSDFWSRSNYGPDTFSPFDVVGHLAHADRTNWLPRIRVILAGAGGGNACDGIAGSSGAEPPALAAFDRYAMYAASRGKSMTDLLDEFTSVRTASIAALRALDLTPARLALPGVHPQIGRVTLAELVAAWTVHDLGHTHQIAKAMAYQYRDAVGPWRELLTILPR